MNMIQEGIKRTGDPLFCNLSLLYKWKNLVSANTVNWQMMKKLKFFLNWWKIQRVFFV